MRKKSVLDIRELLRYLQQGQSERDIQSALGLSRRTIRKYHRWAKQQGLLTSPLPSAAEIHAKLQATQPSLPPQLISKAAAHRDEIVSLRQQGVEIQAIYQHLCEERGYGGSYSAVWRLMQRLEPHRPEATVRVEVKPGEEAQVDFGYAGKMYDPQQQKVRKTWAFVMTLSHSRHQYVEFVFDQSSTTWLELHGQALEFFGGVPARIKLDNLKAAIVKACVEDPQVQRAYQDCAEHYGFLISPCRVATPQHKGKVENGVHYVQRNFLATRDYTTPHHTIRQANQDVRSWVQETAGQRIHGTTKQQPLVCFQEVERAALRPLPATPFEVVLWKESKLHRDCYIVFENAYYSAPHRLIGQTLWVRGTAKSVEIQADFQRVAIHSRVPPGQRQTLLAHLPPTKVAGLTLTPTSCLDRAAAIGVNTLEVVTRWLHDRPLDRLRAVHRLLQVAEKNGGDKQVESACARALEFDDASTRTLFSLLKSGAADGDVSPPVETWPRFARQPHEIVPKTLPSGETHAPHA